VVAWESVEDGGVRLYSQPLDSDGRALRQANPIGAEVGGNRNRPAIAYLKKQDVFFVVWDNSAFDDVPDGIFGQFLDDTGKLREKALAVTTAKGGQYRPHLAASKDSFLSVWTDYRGTGDGGEHKVYEYYGRAIGNDMALSSRWKNPQSQ
jgi:hypothetical protein